MLIMFGTVTGSTWLLRALRLFFVKIALRGSYGTDLHEGVTEALCRGHTFA